jgi:hypothetical protein
VMCDLGNRRKRSGRRTTLETLQWLSKPYGWCRLFMSGGRQRYYSLCLQLKGRCQPSSLIFELYSEKASKYVRCGERHARNWGRS